MTPIPSVSLQCYTQLRQTKARDKFFCTQVSINSVYGKKKKKWTDEPWFVYRWSSKLYVGTMETVFVDVAINYHYYQLSKYLRIYRQRRSRRQQLLPTCYTNSAEGSIHGSIWKNQQLPTVFLQDAKNHKYWTAARHYAHYRSNTNNKLTFFQKVLVFSDGKQSFKPCLIVLLGVLLLHLDVNSSHAHGQH